MADEANIAAEATPPMASPAAEAGVAAKLKPSVANKKSPTQAKEPIMAKTIDFTKSMTDAMADIQTRAKDAYEKTTATAGEFGELTKGNVEALVESGSILSSGIQDIGKTCADEAKSAFETLTADMKEIAAIKSPTELFQLQGKLMRRNFDSLVAMSSKTSETMVKLANDAMAPLSGRMTMAADKLAKVA